MNRNRSGVPSVYSVRAGHRPIWRDPVMLRVCTLAALLSCASSAPTSAAESVPPPANPKTDQYGDPLPDGAVARLGTGRYWAPESRPAMDGGRRVRFSGDGNLLAVWGGGRFESANLRVCRSDTLKDLS